MRGVGGQHSRWSTLFLLTPATILLLVVVAVPIIATVRMSLYESPQGRGFYRPDTWTFEHYRTISDAHSQGIIETTILFAATVSGVCLLTGLPTALYLASLSLRWRTVGLTILLAPKFVGGAVGVFGLQYTLSATGPINRCLIRLGLTSEPLRLSRNFIGAVIGEWQQILPWVVIILLIQRRRIDESLFDAARGLGANRRQVFLRVTWPLLRAAVGLSLGLSFLWAMGALLGPMLLGGPEEATIMVEMHRQAFEYSRWPRAAAWAILGLVLMIGMRGVAQILVLSKRLR